MKKLLLFTILSCLLTGCYTNVIEGENIWGGDDDDEGGGSGDNYTLTIYDPSQLHQDMTAEGGVCKIAFSASEAWFVGFENIGSDWIRVSPSSSEYGGDAELTLYVDENLSGSFRDALLTLNCGNGKEEIHIRQSETYMDGTLPAPYEPVIYPDMIDHINVYYKENGVIQDYSEKWQLNYDMSGALPVVRSVEKFSSYEKADGEPRWEIAETVVYHERGIEHDFYGIKTSDMQRDLLYKYYYETDLGASQVLKHVNVHYIDFENKQETPMSEIYYMYKNFYLQSKTENNALIRYNWDEGRLMNVDLTEQGGETKGLLYSYGNYQNDRTNMDINAFLQSDVAGMFGYLGRRSGALVSDIIDSKGMMRNFQYEFDSENRVSAIEERCDVPDMQESVFIRYEIIYCDDNGSGMK